MQPSQCAATPSASAISSLNLVDSAPAARADCASWLKACIAPGWLRRIGASSVEISRVRWGKKVEGDVMVQECRGGGTAGLRQRKSCSPMRDAAPSADGGPHEL